MSTIYSGFSSAAEVSGVTVSATATKLESAAFFVFMLTVIIAPLAIVPTPYVALDTVKTAVIALGTLLAAILYGINAYKERKIMLPPRRTIVAAGLVALSLIVSSVLSTHFGKSFFGQGFELTSASFILVVLLAGALSYVAVQRKVERTMMIYIGIVAVFVFLFVFHVARFMFGPTFLSFDILNTVTSTMLGTWYDLATYAGIVCMVTLAAFISLPLSRRLNVLYGLLILAGILALYVINSTFAWSALAITLALLTLFLSVQKVRSDEYTDTPLLKKIAWIPLVAFLIAALFSWKGAVLASPAITKLNAVYGTVTLPWQYSMDVAVGSAKQHPLFGVGPNHYAEAYQTNKPSDINLSNAWNTEFNYSFGLIPTFVTTQGIVGILAWLILLGGIAFLLIRGLKNMPEDSHVRFIIISSTFASLFLWVVSFISVPSHTIFFMTCVCTGLALGSGVAYGIVPKYSSEDSGKDMSLSARITLIVLIIVGTLWGIVYIKKAAALAYFGSGIKAMSLTSDTSRADRQFAMATRLDTSDVYLQARAETALISANAKLAEINSSTSTAASQAIANEAVELIKTALTFSLDAREYDPTNYYNYISEARVSALAASIRMDKGYENAVASYQNALKYSPLNPALYLAIAQLHASQNKLDEALASVGSALQLKNNYLDAIFLLSQISAAQGKIKDAITAAQVAAQINPQSPVIYFQLGLLQYNDKNYTEAATALEKALVLQPEYANAKYFLGLSYARLNKTAEAVQQFEELSVSNPESDEVMLILGNLRAGRSAFADAKPPVTPTPEKRPKLPITEKKK